MTQFDKILPIEQLAEITGSIRDEGKKVVLCHGVFDLLHVGHLRHFREAKAMGSVLVVTLTTDKFVNKGPHRPAFNEELRAEMIAALECVDFVSISRWPTAVEVIRLLRPDVYVKGPDYKNPSSDLTGKIGEEEEAVSGVGGQIAYTSDITFSASALINRHMSGFPPETQSFLTEFGRRRHIDEVLGYVHNAEKLKVLLVGEAIIDEYVYCNAIGKSSKEPTLVVKHAGSEKFAGGILAAANHVAGFCNEVGVITQLGVENSHEAYIDRMLRPNVKRCFLYRKNAPTILKQRIVEKYFFTKLLEIYDINDGMIDNEEDDAVCGALLQQLPNYDLVVVIDFGHSMLSERAIGILQNRSKFLVVNAQTNAGNLGHHVLSRYSKPDYMSCTENELRLEARDRTGEINKIAREVRTRIGCKQMAITRGSNGCLCIGADGQTLQVPAVAGKVVDRIGAGDAFLSVSALVAYQKAPMDVIGLIGNAAGALAVATVGNREPVHKMALMKHLVSLLK